MKDKDSFKPKLALFLDISFLCLNYVIPILYSIYWLKFGGAEHLAGLANQQHPQNLVLQMVLFTTVFVGVYAVLVFAVNVLKDFLYFATGLRKNIFASRKFGLVRIIYLIPGLRRIIKVTPLSEYNRALYDRLIDWAKSHRKDIKDIQVFHTKHYLQETNAFFLGVGPISKVMLVDALFDHYSPSEIEAIVAHECGHENDLIRTWSTVLLRIIGAALIVAWGAWYVIASRITSSIPLTILFVILYWFFTQLYDNVISKYRELLADTYAILHIPNGRSFKSVIRKMTAENNEMMSLQELLNFFSILTLLPPSGWRMRNSDKFQCK